jgi:cytoskeletal protein CcmA (bactofilin family)
MVQARWWPLARTQTGVKVPRRSRKKIGEVFLGPETLLSGELKSCDTLVVEGTVDSSRIECRKFILGNAGSCKGEVQAESAVISGRFEGRLIVRARLLINRVGRSEAAFSTGTSKSNPAASFRATWPCIQLPTPPPKMD